ncbi:RagB/SusD family nutrient uptake outer membrane protein [Dyadobacter sp. CY323]|uniref:RagB/SusD family nutrient uptake outer membrane protein n=1 Tax=Dyadobacter sp. CY323 TaxID=2907302 RepID=UPI001F3FFFE7|nr:RagB/SusD family nutrient uptake outer membrane protein [Dyadobacter sp. CY323]MCE6991414.1 RagB/SusD family nutrient uptake outer membrane protein [Dyadobacter sp. CY323]
MLLRKNYISWLLICAISAAHLSCQKFETEPVDARTEELIYDENDINGFFAEQAVTNLYTFLPKGFNRVDGAYLDAATDDGVSSQLTSDIYLLSKGLQSATHPVDERFAESYTAIYRVNQFLSKIDVVPVAAQTKQNWKAEARFIRAISYFELVKRYGGVPLLGDAVLRLEDKIRTPKNSYEECIQYIVSECDAISGLLLKEPVSAVQVGRITQGATLALKARTLLYAASPLNNPSGDPAKWRAAADAAKAVIDLNYYALNSSFTNAFITRNDKEVILAFQEARNLTLETAQSPVGYVSNVYTSNGSISPSQELVDAFPTITGKAIADTSSGYRANNPYANRDPRFGATIFYNGAQWLGRAVETFEGGADKPNTSLPQTKTGYYLRKFLPDLSAASDYATADHNFIIFRYAETLLNYAEAINESGNDAANQKLAYEQLVKLRKRAGITAGTDGLFGVKANMTQAELRSAIRLERRIELAFEEHRFWDVRRWNTGNVDFNKTIQGIRITKVAPTEFTYQKVNVEPLVFIAPKMNVYPFPFAELQANGALQQNPGW